MSIYATLWHLQFPRHGDAYIGCEWVDVLAQGVPAHIGTPTPGYGYESGDPYEPFLPPALRIESGVSEDDLRAVVFVVSTSKKGTVRSGQEYESPLLVLTGIHAFQFLGERQSVFHPSKQLASSLQHFRSCSSQSNQLSTCDLTVEGP